jgi:hypothetical protein
LNVRGTTLSTAALGLALTATSAYAGGTPINIPFGTTQPDTHFQLTGPSDFQDLKACSPQEQDAYVGMVSQGIVDAVITDAAGRQTGKFSAVSDDTEGTGAELHPKGNGCFNIRVTPSPNDASQYFPINSSVWFWPDCRGGPATRCTIAAGKTKAGTWGGDNDGDSFVIEAPAGRYAVTLTITSGQAAAILSVLDGSGNVIVSRKTGTGPQSRLTRTLKFALPVSGGPFYVNAEATGQDHAGRGTYDLTLKPL